MANRCIHGLQGPDRHNVCADCAGLTRVVGATSSAGGDTVEPKKARPEDGICRRCGEPSTTKESVSVILRPWCDACRREAAAALRAGGAVRLKNLDVFFELRRAGNSRRATMDEHIGERVT